MVKEMNDLITTKNQRDLVNEINQACFSEEGIKKFPFVDRRLIMHPFENHVNFRIIRAAVEAIKREKGEGVLQAITDSVNKFYSMFSNEDIKQIMFRMDFDSAFNLKDKLSQTDNKPPFKSYDTEKESLWMSYESYQIFNWICESISQEKNFLFKANTIELDREKNIQRLFKSGLTPELTFKYATPQFARKYNNTIYLRPIEVISGKAIYELKVVHRFIDRSNVDNFRRGEVITQARLCYIPKLFGLELGKLKVHEMMARGDKRGVYEITYEKGIIRKYWDLTLGTLWAATVGTRTILSEQVHEAEERGDKYLEISKNLEGIVDDRTKELRIANTELKAAYSDLERAQKERLKAERERAEAEKRAATGLLAKGVAHNQHNKLHKILSYLEPVIMTLEDGGTLIGYIKNKDYESAGRFIDDIGLEEEISRSGETFGIIKKTLNEVLHNIKILKGYTEKDVSQFRRLDVEGLVNEVLRVYQADLSGVDIDLKLEKKSYCLKGDQTGIEYVIQNLVENSLEAMQGRPEKKLKIMTRYIPKAKKYILVVKDSGPGMPDDVMKKAFDPSYTTKELKEGTHRGMGLYTVWSTVEAHSGRIMPRSKEGKYTMMKVVLPAV